MSENNNLPEEPCGFISPAKPRYGDRFIPTRAGNLWDLTYPHSKLPCCINHDDDTNGADVETSSLGSKKRRLDESEDTVYSRLLSNEILGYETSDKAQLTPRHNKTISMPKPIRANRKLFHYDSAERPGTVNEMMSSYSKSPLSKHSKSLIESPHRDGVRIHNAPYKVLDAPDLEDDFYLNLLDWSNLGYLGVGLSQCVYILKVGVQNSEALRLCSFESERVRKSVTAVNWNNCGDTMAIGTSKGTVQIWDIATFKKVTELHEHCSRVSSLAWNGDIIFSGSKDRSITVTDLREPAVPKRRLLNHTQEICGLKWSENNGLLASGGNDNKLNIWDWRTNRKNPLFSFTDHLAAIKGLGWNPHDHGVLASGGGTADRKIRMWNTQLGTCTKVIDTGSQVCNLVWSKHSPEFVTTHGFINNEVALWKYPSLRQSCRLQAHKARVLYLAISPDGEDIVTGAGHPDETLRMWKVFPSAKHRKRIQSAVELFNIR